MNNSIFVLASTNFFSFHFSSMLIARKDFYLYSIYLVGKKKKLGKNVGKGNRNGDGGINGGMYWVGLTEAGQDEGEKV